MIFEYRKRVSAFPPQALLAASKTCPCPGVRIDARTDSNTVNVIKLSLRKGQNSYRK